MDIAKTNIKIRKQVLSKTIGLTEGYVTKDGRLKLNGFFSIEELSQIISILIEDMGLEDAA